MSNRVARGWNLSIAVLVAGALLVQLWIAIRVSSTPSGHAVGTLRGAPTANRLLRVFSFFTIQSNIFSGVTAAELARTPNRDGQAWRALRLAALFGIAVTGIVYGTVLARIHEPHGWQETTTNTTFHYIVPIMMVVGWLFFGPRRRIEGRTIALATSWPIAWFIYILIYGRITKWYPYPFVDVTTHGYLRVVVNGILVIAVLLVVTTLFWLGDQRLRATDLDPADVEKVG